MPDEPFSVVKITLWGPVPWGGSYTSTLDDERVDRLVVEGWTIRRAWSVDFDGEIFVTEDVR